MRNVLVQKIALVLLALTPLTAFAQGPKATPAPAATGGDKLDVTDLEKKYWAAKDSDFNVVQNRLFSKANRFSLSGSYGMGLNDSWSDNPTKGFNLGYYFSERWGIELNYTSTDSKDNKAVERLVAQTGYPNHNLVKDFYGVAVNWVPFYAKMSFLNSSIVYFDMGVSLGAGMINYEQLRDNGNSMKSSPAVSINLTQQFFLNKWLAIRADYRHLFYNEEILWFRSATAPNGARVESTTLSNNSLLMLGLTLYY